MDIFVTIVLFFLQFSLIESKVHETTAINKFKHILLIVKYNFDPTESQVLLYYKLWSHVFTHIYIAIPTYEQVPVLQSCLNNYTNSNVHNKNTHSNITVTNTTDNKGFYAYRSVLEAMSTHPHYHGYLFAHDDMAMNISNLIHMNLHAPACNGHGLYNLENSWNLRNHTWNPWNTDLTSINNIITNYTYINHILQNCTGSIYNWYKGQSDFFYIPYRYKYSFIKYMNIFRKYNIFLEIAIPTCIRCLISSHTHNSDSSSTTTTTSNHNTVQTFPLCTNWDYSTRGDISYYKEHCSPSDSHIHPVKLNSPERIEFMADFMDLEADND